MQELIDMLIMGGPSGWWLRIADHDDVMYKTKTEAVRALLDIL